ncbi:MAG: hypothetical protein J1E64_10455 [Acetatifactor sp.]|nr:hypothetical protein [Acetatifactor sp.]
MKFDKKAPGRGVDIFAKLENGKAMLEFSFYTEGQEKRTGYYADVYLYDREGSCVLQFFYPMDSEEPAKGLLLHPHLWNSVEDPYLYRIEVFLLRQWEGQWSICDRLRCIFPLCTLKRVLGKGWSLNGRPFVLKAVEYELPQKVEAGVPREARVLQDIEKLQELGANAICLRKGGLEQGFYELCCRRGLALLWMGSENSIVLEPNSIARWGDLLNERGKPTDRYYFYRALWSDDPFVYLSQDSLIRQENGLYQVTAYSNLKKVALYVEGHLFEFQSGAPEFLFFDVEIRRFPTVLTVETDSFGMSVTVYGMRYL